jgi:glycogen debranching enzyme
MNNYFMETHNHEWILTNRRGGYALGTGNLINQRKYHGLLIASDDNFQRTHLVAGIDETVEWRGLTFHLDSNNYSNCVYPEGFLHLVKPWLRPYPAFLYSALPHQNEIMVLKEIMMDEKSNTTLVRYTNLGCHKLHFELHPKYTMLNHHEVNYPGSLDSEQFETDIRASAQGCFFNAERVSNHARVCGYASMGDVLENRFTYYNVFYPWEVMKGYPGIGDQLTLFEIRFDLPVGESFCLLFSDTTIAKPQAVIHGILARYAELPHPADFPQTGNANPSILESLDFNDSCLFNYDEYLKILEFCLQDFLTADDIVAGFPWYGPWGRDTMFVLNAMLHSKTQVKIVENILKKYSFYIRDGLIPNMLPETGRQADYDSVDATLWYVILLYKLGKKKNTVTFWKEAISTANGILRAFLDNHTYPFHIREDGLIELHKEFAHATWMDVRQNNVAITPRDGAPVEINALWYNAICSYEDMVLRHNELSSRKIKINNEITAYKEKVLESFQKFWIGDYLADRLLNDEPVAEIRPNALLAVALPWTMLSRDKLEKIFDRAYKELYTYYGIRSLSPYDIKFKKKYYGPQHVRDLAYHNGSTWAWLFGAFCGLYVKISENSKPATRMAEDLSNFIGSFRQGFMKGHIATVAEIWDGDAPHFPKGAPAMAWSVAALYNIETYIASLEKK